MGIVIQKVNYLNVHSPHLGLANYLPTKCHVLTSYAMILIELIKYQSKFKIAICEEINYQNHGHNTKGVHFSCT
jgi:hypothetical protein